MGEYSFLCYKPSLITSAFLLNSIQNYTNDIKLVENIKHELETIIKLDAKQCSMENLQNKIFQLINDDDEFEIIGLTKANATRKELSYTAIGMHDNNAPKSSPRTVISHAA